jgi:hypothetical protein
MNCVKAMTDSNQFDPSCDILGRHSDSRHNRDQITKQCNTTKQGYRDEEQEASHPQLLTVAKSITVK